jgi:hypothetical protein
MRLRNMAADELNKQGFTAKTVEGGYPTRKNKKKKNDEGGNNK